MSKKRRKLKSAVIVGATQTDAKIDLRDVYLPFNTEAAIVVVDDPAVKIRAFAAMAPAERSKPAKDGSLKPGADQAEELRYTVPRREVIVALRGNTLGKMYVREQISDIQWCAGRRYRDDIDTSLIGGARAIDYSRAKVDGGKLGDPLGGNSLAARDRLHRADAAMTRADGIGHNGIAICRAVLGEGLTITDFSRRVGADSKYGIKKMGDLFRSCLDILAEVYGLATRRAA